MSVESAYDTWAVQYDTDDNKTRDLDGLATVETLSRYDFRDVLELGCGTGKNTSWLLGSARKVIGVDFSREMLRIARQKVTDPRVTFKRADLTSAWDLKNQSFDLVTASLTLEHIDDLNAIFRQSSQILRQGGIFFVCELHPFRQYTGSLARFETEVGVQTLEAYVHHISDYLGSAKNHGFELDELREWFDQGCEADLPRLVSFVFRKVV